MAPHILIVADGRSPTALSWIRHMQSLGYCISLLSTFPCETPAGLDHFHILPIAFSHFSKESTSDKTPSREKRSKKLGKAICTSSAVSAVPFGSADPSLSRQGLSELGE